MTNAIAGFGSTAVLALDQVQFFGVTLVGVNATTGVKLLFTAGLIAAVWVLRRLAAGLLRGVLGGDPADARRFWARQAIQVALAVVTTVGLVSIWVTPETDLSTGIGLISAGLAFALRQVIISLAGYFAILRGSTFNVGDRITMGGVRGDVVRLGFLRTTIMEMGQPPALAAADPAMWVNSRQYTGRLVTVTNGVIFSHPVYNYTRDFPYIWEEIAVPVSYTADRTAAERILLAAAQAHAVVDDPDAEQALAAMRSRFALSDASLTPEVYWRITDNWLELSLRFLVRPRGVREVKDAMTRDILRAFDAHGIGIAFPTYGIAELPEVTARIRDSDGGVGAEGS